MDSLGDMLTILINAQRVGKERVAVPHSRFKEQLAHFLQTKGLVANVRVQKGPKPKLIISLNNEDGSTRLESMRRLSKPGRRWYVGSRQIPYADDKTVFIVSTPQGLMDGREARAQGLGGELICAVN